MQDVALTLRDRQRVVVIGNSGSGKSYFAQALAAQHDAPVLDLDTVFWLDGSYQAKRPAAAVAAILQQWRAKGRWIIEGVYGDLVEPFLPRAGLLVWLALPWADCARSLLEREFECRPLRTPQVDKAFDALMVYGAAYDLRTNGISRTAHQRLFDRFEGTKFTFESREEVDRFLGGLAASTP